MRLRLPVAYSSNRRVLEWFNLEGCQGRYLITRLREICLIMLRVIVNEGDKIDRALKQFKRKVNNTKLIQQLRARKQFEKPSVTARKGKLRAEYIQRLRNEQE